MVKKINLLVLMLLVIGIISQQIFAADIPLDQTIDPFKDSGLTFNPANPNAFDWSKGDFSGINWGLVTMTPQIWNQIKLENIQHIPADKLDPNQMSVEQIAKVSPYKKSQIPSQKLQNNLHKLGNLEDYGKNGKDAFKKKYGVSIDTFGKGKEGSTITESGVLTVGYGAKGHITLKGDAYKGGSLTVLTDGNILFTAKGEGEALDLPTADVLRISIPSGKKVVYNKKETLSGEVSFVKGEFRIKAGNIATINGIEIFAGSQDTKIYFDGKDCSSYCISINKDTGKLYARGPKSIEFGPENPFFKYDQNKRITVVMTEGSRLSIQTRSGLIPAMKTYGDIDIQNGNYKYTTKGNEFRQSKLGFTSKESYAFTINAYTTSGSNILGGIKYNNHRIVFDESNNYVIWDKFLSSGLNIESPNSALNFHSAQVSQHIFGKIRRMTPNLKFMSGTSQEEINRVYFIIKDVIPTLSWEMRKSMEELVLFSESSEAPCGTDAYGCALGKRLYLSKKELDLSKSSKISKHTVDDAGKIFTHELSHILTDKIILQQGARSYDPKTKKWGPDLNKAGFYKDWVAAAGGKFVYYYDLKNIPSGSQNYYTGKSPGSNLGMVRGYGAQDPKEDIATYMEKIATADYTLLGKLAADKEWGTRSLNKIKLLRRHEFITANQFGKIMTAYGNEVGKQLIADQAKLLASLQKTS